MWFWCMLLCILSGLQYSQGFEDVITGHKLHNHRNVNRKYRAVNDGALRFEPEPYSKKLELNSPGKIHCKVAGGVSPNVTWYLNESDPLPDGMTSSNGTLLVLEAAKRHSGKYTCRAVDGDRVIEADIHLDVVVSPKVIEPSPDQQVHAVIGSSVAVHCVATGDPPPTTHWDKNRTHLIQNGAESDGVNSSASKYEILSNGTLLIRSLAESDGDVYGCTAGSAAGMSRAELTLIVHKEGELPPSESTGVAGKAVVVSISVAGAYMLLVLALMVYCRRRRLKRRQAGEKLELEMVEGREKLVEEGEEEKKVANGGPPQNGRLLTHDRDSGADNSEVSAVSRVSKRSGQFDQLSIPRSLLTEQITLGRGEFGEVLQAKIDMKKLKTKEEIQETDIQPVLVKVLTTKDEVQLAEFRRQIDLFSRVRHNTIVRLIGLCNEVEPHYMVLQHTDWGDLKSFLQSTRTAEEQAEYESRIGPSLSLPPRQTGATPLSPPHQASIVMQLATAGAKIAGKRLTHRDISCRNCVLSSRLQVKLSLAALTRGPHSHDYYKLHDQVIPLRWLPLEAVTEGEYSTKSDVYMFAATVWEIYTKAEMPFAKLNDNSVLERLKNGTLEWTIPSNMPEALAQLLKQCWKQSPSERPQFTEICETMSNILQEIASEKSESVSQKSQEKINEN